MKIEKFYKQHKFSKQLMIYEEEKTEFYKINKKKKMHISVNVQKKGERSSPAMVCQVVYMVINLKKMFTNIDKARVSRFTVLQGRAAGWVEC